MTERFKPAVKLQLGSQLSREHSRRSPLRKTIRITESRVLYNKSTVYARTGTSSTVSFEKNGAI